MLVSVSFLKNINGNEKTIRDIDSSIADYIHVDIMDGRFVSNKNYTYDDIKNYFIGINKPLDIHLMVDDALEYIKDFVKLKPEYITFHVECKSNINECITYLKERNIKVGLALNPETKIYNIMDYLDKVDLILVMGVHPGLGGQKFIDGMTKKINELKVLKTKHNFITSVDGGVNENTIGKINSDMVVAGSYVVLSDNYNEKIEQLKQK